MRKPLTVREFDTIVAASDDQLNNESYKTLDAGSFEELLKFVRDGKADEETADVLEFLKIGFKRGVGYTLRPVNYVGLIQMANGTQIEILPKVSFDSEEDTDCVRTKKIFLRMLQSLKDFPCKVSAMSDLSIARLNLYEIFIRMYLDAVRQLVRQGIRSAYVSYEENLKVFKGKLNVAQQIRLNAAHQERFAVTHDEFLPDRPENRLIKTTLNKLRNMTFSPESGKRIRQLMDAFDGVGMSDNIHADLDKVVLDRNMDYYAEIIRWSRIFLENKSFTSFSGADRARALLFPMETVYESYVAQQLRRVFVPEGWSVSTQEKGHWLFMEPSRKFALRPDIVIRKDGRTVILDTKWKRLTNDPRFNYGISQADMYQMYAYGKKYGASEIWLLYPMTEEMRECGPLRFNSGDGVTVQVHFVDLTEAAQGKGDIRANMKELMGKIENWYV